MINTWCVGQVLFDRRLVESGFLLLKSYSAFVIGLNLALVLVAWYLVFLLNRIALFHILPCSLD